MLSDGPQYANAHAYFKNIDKLIHFANRDGRLNVFYSTPAAYVAAKHAYREPWPLKTDDFFPYADCPHCYWTGEIDGICCAGLAQGHGSSEVVRAYKPDCGSKAHRTLSFRGQL